MIQNQIDEKYRKRFDGIDIIIEKSAFRGKAVMQINSTTNQLIDIWNSIEEAEKETGANRKGISLCCRNKQKTCGGYKWRFVE